MPKQTLQGFLYSSKSICGIQNTLNFPFWQLSCISRFKLLGFWRNTCSPAPLPLSISNKFTLAFISDSGCGLGGRQEGRNGFTFSSRDFFLLSDVFHWGWIPPSVQVLFFFLSFFPSFCLSFSLSFPPSLPFSPLPFTVADVSSGT